MYVELSGKSKLKHEERLKKILLMTRKSNVAMRELNGHIDHNYVLVI